MARGYPKRGFARAKPVLSEAEGTPRTPSDGTRPVIPSECEGSEKDFSGVYPELAEGVEMTKRGPFDFAQDMLCAFARDIDFRI